MLMTNEELIDGIEKFKNKPHVVEQFREILELRERVQELESANNQSNLIAEIALRLDYNKVKKDNEVLNNNLVTSQALLKRCHEAISTVASLGHLPEGGESPGNWIHFEQLDGLLKKHLRKS